MHAVPAKSQAPRLSCLGACVFGVQHARPLWSSKRGPVSARQPRGQTYVRICGARFKKRNIKRDQVAQKVLCCWSVSVVDLLTAEGWPVADGTSPAACSRAFGAVQPTSCSRWPGHLRLDGGSVRGPAHKPCVILHRPSQPKFASASHAPRQQLNRLSPVGRRRPQPHTTRSSRPIGAGRDCGTWYPPGNFLRRGR